MFESKKDKEIDFQIGEDLSAINESTSTIGGRLKFFKFMGISLLVPWAFVLVFPNWIYDFYGTWGVGKISGIPIAIVFFGSVLFAYALIQHFVADIDENKLLESEIMQTASYQQSSNRRYFAWIGSVLAGFLHIVLLTSVCSTLVTYNLYLFE